MLSKPESCRGCPLADRSTGFMRPSLAAGDVPGGAYGVALLGEALGADEADQGAPFVGMAGHRLSRLIEWAGFEQAGFDIYNAAWCQPPHNQLEGQPWEAEAVAHCRRAHWGALLERARVVVPMGNVPMAILLGHKGILSWRGYLEGREGRYILPTVHPSFIQRGQARWSAAFINDLQKAVQVARDGVPPQLTTYCLDPSPAEALQWVRDYQSYTVGYPQTRLAVDIETPGKPDEEDEADLSTEAPDRTWQITRVGLAYRPLEALSVPWNPTYIPALRLALTSDGQKVVWNAGFDIPRLKRAGIAVNGLIHDGMVAWHILHSDLPKRLGFVATFTCPYQPAWKHLSAQKPAYYNAADADVEARSFTEIEQALRQTGLWRVYQEDVLDLEPILLAMSRAGMPVDAEVRAHYAQQLADRLFAVQHQLTVQIPLEARRIDHVFAKPPRDTTDLLTRRATRSVPVCALCGTLRPRKAHFKRFVKKVNACADAGVETREQDIDEYYRLAQFTPSRDQLIRYHQFVKRPLPTTWDKRTRTRRTSFGEHQIKNLMLKYPGDPVYRLVLEYRGLDKIAGTYIGRPSNGKEVDS